MIYSGERMLRIERILISSKSQRAYIDERYYFEGDSLLLRLLAQLRDCKFFLTGCNWRRSRHCLPAYKLIDSLGHQGDGTTGVCSIRGVVELVPVGFSQH